MHMHEIVEAEIAAYRQQFDHQGELYILETGTIRQDTEAHRQGDGWSTLAFAREVQARGGHVTSIDLHVETAQGVLEREGVADLVKLQRGYSIDMMAAMAAWGELFDVILLDSENDAQLILHEYMLARQLLRRPGLILVDDVVPGSSTVVKGQQLLPWLDAAALAYRITPRTGGGVHSGVLSMVLA